MKTSLEDFTAICRKNLIPEAEYRIVAGFYKDTLYNIEPRDPVFPLTFHWPTLIATYIAQQRPY